MMQSQFFVVDFNLCNNNLKTECQTSKFEPWKENTAGLNHSMFPMSLLADHNVH